jgi:tetratricopeptide (TPR) repeat protein
LTTAGRPAEAIPHIRTAMRVDPHYPPEFMLWLGLAQFALEDFKDAAAAFETATKLSPDDEYPFMALASSLAHLGRTEGALAALARYNTISIEHGGAPLTMANAAWLRFRRGADVERLLAGLRLLGVPMSLTSGDFAGLNKLSDDEVRALFFGHRLRGRSPLAGAERAGSIRADGVATWSGDWGKFTGRTVRFTGDQVCFELFCGRVFRFPAGTKAKENEHLWIDSRGAFTFSQIE